MYEVKQYIIKINKVYKIVSKIYDYVIANKYT